MLGGIKFSLSRDDIQTITFKGNNDEDIAGKVKLEMDVNGKPVAETTEGEKTITLTPKEGTTFASNTNYYIVMLPTVLSNGFTMTFETETAIGTFEYTTKSIEIKRSVFSKKENIDSYATFDWKVDPNLQKPFTIKSNGSTTVALTYMYSNPNLLNLEYRIGSGAWNEYTVCYSSDYLDGKAQNSIIELSDGDELQFRAGEGGNAKFSSYDNYYKFEVAGTGTIGLYGNIMSLLDPEMELNVLPQCAFSHLFYCCRNLTDISSLKLPATKLDYRCYYEMFGSCVNISSTPELPATELASECYYGMFDFCTGLTEAPKLPATKMEQMCYYGMFAYCHKLVSAPELPATTLAGYCYTDMFKECNSLTVAPDLPSTTLASYCYESMFEDCINLTTAPKLPALKLVSNCYSYMFKGCSKLDNVKALFTTEPTSSYTYNWLDGVAATGTFEKNPAATWNVTGSTGVPEGWAVSAALLNNCEAIDLGLSVKWAAYNVGARAPEEIGDIFAWAEISPKEHYDWDNYRYLQLAIDDNDDDRLTKYCVSSNDGWVDNKTKLENKDDAAYVNWGGTWRMPTADEFGQLIQKCEWSWTGDGYRVTGPNGNSIFLPQSTGYSSGDQYWTSNLSRDATGESSYNWSRYAQLLYFTSKEIKLDFCDRWYGYKIRPVTK